MRNSTKNNLNTRTKNRACRRRNGCNGTYPNFVYIHTVLTVQYSTVQYTVPMYWSSNQTITVASVSTVTGSAFVRRFRKFLGQCDKDEHLSRDTEHDSETKKSNNKKRIRGTTDIRSFRDEEHDC